MVSNPPPDKAIRSFADFLADLNHGAVEDKASAELAELVTAVRTHGRKGTLLLKFTVEPLKGNDTVVQVTADLDTRPPRPPAGAAMFYPDQRGSLHRNDPMQPTFDDALKEV